jgi:collagenase-like PrtC family protease
MKIVAPIAKVDEIEALSKAGADELYCGVLPTDWLGKFGDLNANRRPSGNLKSYAELEQAVHTAHASGCSLSLVLNAQRYSDAQSSAVSEIARSFLDMGGDALIVSDLGLIGEMSRWLSLPRIHVSSVATCRNASAAKLCRDLGASRLILPRDVTIDEACEIAREVPDIEVEAFILNDGCVFEEGTCNTIHLPQKFGGPICLDHYVHDYRHRDGSTPSGQLLARLQENDEAYRKWLWYRFSCGFSTTEAGLPFGPCGLCALPAFLAGGLAAVKIAGREAPLGRKVASVKMVRAVLDRAGTGDDAERIRHFAQNLRPSVEHCRTGYMCYYPEVLNTE